MESVGAKDYYKYVDSLYIHPESNLSSLVPNIAILKLNIPFAKTILTPPSMNPNNTILNKIKIDLKPDKMSRLIFPFYHPEVI